MELAVAIRYKNNINLPPLRPFAQRKFEFAVLQFENQWRSKNHPISNRHKLTNCLMVLFRVMFRVIHPEWSFLAMGTQEDFENSSLREKL